jgi:hypothetical protein
MALALALALALSTVPYDSPCPETSHRSFRHRRPPAAVRGIRHLTGRTTRPNRSQKCRPNPKRETLALPSSVPSSSRKQRMPTASTDGISDGIGQGAAPLRLQESRSACWRPDRRHLASAPRCRSCGGAATRRRRLRRCWKGRCDPRSHETSELLDCRIKLVSSVIV